MKYMTTKFLMTFLLVNLIFGKVKAQTWVEKASIQQGASGRGAAQSFVLNNKLYVAGGYVGFTAGYTIDMQMFDPVANTWVSKTPPVEANRSSGISFVINGKAYMGLGAKNFLSFSPPQVLLTDMNEYNDVSNNWIPKAAFPDSGRTDCAVFVTGGKAYVIGGEKGSSQVKTAEVWEYNPVSNAWTKKADFSGGAIANATGFSDGNKAFVTGGILANGTISNKTYEYNAASDTWTAKANLPVSNQGGTAFVIGSNAYYGLGSNMNLGGAGASFLTTFYKYDITANTWTAAAFNWTAAGRLWPVAGVINNKAYVGAGYKYAGGEFAYKDLFELSFAPNSTNDIESAHQLIFYPNPANDLLNINTGGQQSLVEIYNVTGQRILSNEHRDNAAIDISGIADGHYILSVKNADGTAKEKLLIRR